MMKKTHGLRKDSIDICVKVVLCRLQVDSLFYHGLFHRLKENLCLAHLLSKHFSKLCVCRDILLYIFSFLSLRYCHTAFFQPFLDISSQRCHHVSDGFNFVQQSLLVLAGTFFVQQGAAPAAPCSSPLPNPNIKT